MLQTARRWTQEEDQFIKDNYLTMTDKEIGDQINRSEHSVHSERCKLSLYRPTKKILGHKRCTMLTYEEVSTLFSDRGYELLSSEKEYKGMTTKLRYLCPKHRDKGELLIDASHLKSGRGCYYCGREKTAQAKVSTATPDDDRQICEKHNFEYVKSVRNDTDNKWYIYFVCPKHKEFGVQKMTRGNMNRDINSCQYCSGKNLPHWYIEQQISTQYPHIKVISEYNGMNKKLKCHCLRHDIEFEHDAKEIFYNGSGCSLCKKELLSENSMLSREDIIDRIRDKYPEIELLSIEEFCGYYSKLKVKCRLCGFEWFATLGDLHNQNHHCPKCYVRSSISNGEISIANTLNKNQIIFSAYYQIEECRNINPLPFDFALFDDGYRLIGLIEYNGIQHYQAVDYFGGEEKFMIRKKCDQIKQHYCDEHNIPLLIIPYWDYDNIEKLLLDFINNL